MPMESVRFYLRAPIKYQIKKDDGNSDPQIVVTPAFPTDPGSLSSLAAESWAGDKNPRTVEVDNGPRAGYRLVGFEKSLGGSSGWKVLTPEGFLVDIKEDVLGPVLLSTGVLEGGVIPVPLLWIKSGSHLRLDRPESARTRAAEQKSLATPKKPVSSVRMRDLVEGGIYVLSGASHKGKPLVYVGRIRIGDNIKTAWFSPSIRSHPPTTEAIQEQIRLADVPDLVVVPRPKVLRRVPEIVVDVASLKKEFVWGAPLVRLYDSWYCRIHNPFSWK